MAQEKLRKSSPCRMLQANAPPADVSSTASAELGRSTLDMLALVGSPAPPRAQAVQVITVEEEEKEDDDEPKQQQEEEGEDNDDFAEPTARRRQPLRKAQQKPLKKKKKQAPQPPAKAPLPEDAFEVFHPHPRPLRRSSHRFISRDEC